MNLRDLRYVLAVAEHRHFGKAAEASFVSQPTLSGQIKKVEEELGVTIFERSNRSVEITPIGEQLLIYARRVIEQVTLAGGSGAGAGGVASVDSSTLPGLLTTVSMRFCWGAALMGASAPLLVLNSLLLTFFLKRKP